MNHHFPRSEAQYRELQKMILRENALENQVLGMGGGRGGDTYLLSGCAGEPIPVYM